MICRPFIAPVGPSLPLRIIGVFRQCSKHGTRHKQEPHASIKYESSLIASVLMPPLSIVSHLIVTNTYIYNFPLLLPSSSHFASPSLSFGLKLILILFTQCLSSLGFPKRSPLKICPKCPPQLLHTISVLIMPMPGSARWPTAPGTASQNAGHPQPESNLWFAL
jgi:hypothetical protein